MDMVLADLTIDGKPVKAMMHAPKNGFFYVLDRISGELLSAQPFTTVTWATHVDLKTGRPVETPNARYGSKGARLSPSAVGAHHWPPMAFNPATGLVFFPGQDTNMYYQDVPSFSFQEGQWNTGTMRGTTASAAAAANPGVGAVTAAPAGAAPAPPPTRGFFLAWDPAANKERWRIDFRPSGGALSTAGQLVFVGENGGTFYALDPATGKTLWEHKLMTGVATPVSYEIDGKQYIAVMSGMNGGKVFAFTLDGK
jgi:quinohemoprotein ethanol dehydrogenase